MDIVGLLQENANDCLRIMSTYETKQVIMVVLSLKPAKCKLSQSLSGLWAAESKWSQKCYVHRHVRYKKIKKNKQLSQL